MEIETAFKPPDVEEDMYKPSGDDDWHQWLAELMLDDDSELVRLQKKNITIE